MRRQSERIQYDRESEINDFTTPESQIAIPGLGRLRTGVHHPNAHDTGASQKPKLELIDQK
jgi:hypothetical protein